MAVLKFRVYWEEDDAIYRDVLVKHTQNFQDLHTIILKAFEFDQKHDATFYRSNDTWQRGREISKEVYDRAYKVPPLLMEETVIGTEIIDKWDVRCCMKLAKCFEGCLPKNVSVNSVPLLDQDENGEWLVIFNN